MMNEVRSTAQALPDHLRGRDVSLWTDESRIHIPRRGVPPINPEGKIDDWWPVLTQEQQAAIIMASITSGNSDTAEVGAVRLFRSGEMSMQITTSQRQEYFDLHPKA